MACISGLSCEGPLVNLPCRTPDFIRPLLATVWGVAACYYMPSSVDKATLSNQAQNFRLNGTRFLVYWPDKAPVTGYHPLFEVQHQFGSDERRFQRREASQAEEDLDSHIPG